MEGMKRVKMPQEVLGWAPRRRLGRSGCVTGCRAVSRVDLKRVTGDMGDENGLSGQWSGDRAEEAHVRTPKNAIF